MSCEFIGWWLALIPFLRTYLSSFILVEFGPGAYSSVLFDWIDINISFSAAWVISAHVSLN